MFNHELDDHFLKVTTEGLVLCCINLALMANRVGVLKYLAVKVGKIKVTFMAT